MKRFLTVIIITCVFAVTSFAADKPVQTLITNVDIFDGRSTKLTKGQDVLIEDNLIKQIGENLDADEAAITIDGGGRTLTPGFIDAHTHIALIAPFDQLENEYTGFYVGAAGYRRPHPRMKASLSSADSVVRLRLC